MRKYWKNVHQRAFKEASHTVGLETRGQLVMKAGVILIALLCLLFWGSSDASRDETIVRIAIVGALVLFFPFVYLWKLAGVPPAMDAEKNTEIGTLKSAARTQQANVARTRMLTILWERGGDLLAADITLDQLDDWKGRLDAWERLTLRYLANYYSQQEAAVFRVVEFNPTRGSDYRVNAEHAHRWNQTAVRLRTLRSTLDKAPASWSPISAEQRKIAEAILADFETKIAAADRDEAL